MPSNPSFRQVFSGSPVQPAQVSYLSLAPTTDTTLAWPWVQQDTSDTVPFWIDVAPAWPDLSLQMPPANQASVGQAVIIRNTGSFDIAVLTNGEDPIVVVSPGLAWYIIITDNSTLPGLWSQVQFGAGASSAQAAALAGYGLRARLTFLDQNHPVTVLVTDTTITSTHRAQVLTVSPSVGTGALDLDPLADVGDGFFFLFSNLGTGAWQIAPAGGETIDNQAIISLNPLESCEIHAGASGWYTIGRGRNTTFAFTQNTQSVAGSSDVVLSTTQAGNFIQDFFGALTGNINVIVPNAVQPYIVRNNTTGAFSLTVKTATGTGIVCAQGEQTWIYCDGTNVLLADSSTGSTPSLSMPDGTEAAPGLSFTLEPDTGFYRDAPDTLSVSIAGTRAAQFNASGLIVDNNITVQGTDIRMLMTVLG